MAKKKGSSTHKKAMYKVYKDSGRSLLNRTKKLERHVKKFPDDVQAKEALKRGLVTYRRQKPRSKVWTKQDVWIVGLFKKAGVSGTEYLRIKEREKRQMMK